MEPGRFLAPPVSPDGRGPAFATGPGRIHLAIPAVASAFSSGVRGGGNRQASPRRRRLDERGEPALSLAVPPVHSPSADAPRLGHRRLRPLERDWSGCHGVARMLRFAGAVHYAAARAGLSRIVRSPGGDRADDGSLLHAPDRRLFAVSALGPHRAPRFAAPRALVTLEARRKGRCRANGPVRV